MKIFPKKAVAIFLGILLAEIIFLVPVSSQAACNWFAEKTFYQGGEIKTSGGCSDIHTKSADNFCSTAKPTYQQESGSATLAVCCCEKNPIAQTASNEVCSWEKQSIYYDDATRKTVETSCSSGKKNFPDNNCSGNKPTYAPDLYVANKAICCCQENTISKANQVEPPKFIIPELQVNIGAKFSQPVCEPTDSGGHVCSINWLGEYLSTIYDYALKIGGLLAAVMLMAGGVLWLISAGDASRISKAKSIITGSTLGLVLLFSTYMILTQVNPELVKLNPISIGGVSSRQMSNIINDKTSGAAATYAQMGCARDEELVNGIDFYATGYCKPAWEDSDKFRCFIAMNCSCPNGQDSSKNCDEWFGKTYPGYRPCNPFPADTPYCNRTFSGVQPELGMIAAPNCENFWQEGTSVQVCFNGKTYTVTDRGGGIQGRRIDIWTGSDCGAASRVTGVGRMTLGPCSN